MTEIYKPRILNGVKEIVGKCGRRGRRNLRAPLGGNGIVKDK